jgi:hypothetical protein
MPVSQAPTSSAAAGPLSSFGAQVKAINDAPDLTPAQRAYQVGSLAYTQAAGARTNEERMTYAEIGKQMMAVYGHHAALDAGLKANQEATEGYNLGVTNQMALQDKVNTGNLERIKEQAAQAIRVSAANRASEREDNSPSRRIADMAATLTQNPNMSPADYANMQVGDQVQFALASKAPIPDEKAQEATRYAAFRTAAAHRIGEMTAAAAKQSDEGGGGAADFFSEYHPRHAELSAPFRQRVAQNPKQYDAIRQDVVQSISGPIHSALRIKGYPNDFIIQYINDTADGMVGPKPAPTYMQRAWDSIPSFTE